MMKVNFVCGNLVLNVDTRFHSGIGSTFFFGNWICEPPRVGGGCPHDSQPLNSVFSNCVTSALEQ
jgi:hypothetical protein